MALKALLEKWIGSEAGRRIKGYRPIVEQINALEESMIALDEAGFRAKSEEFRAHLASDPSAMGSLMAPAFALVREAARRTLGLRLFDVQLIGGIVLHEGAIAEMKTGEGKTLVATMPAYLNALGGKGVHVVTANEYLAARDAEWMGQIYRYLGLEVGVVVASLGQEARRKAYAADVTYGTNNEFGFDYLRDNMKFEVSAMVQRGHHYAIVDEVDSILIDEARTPLIISGASEQGAGLYLELNRLAAGLDERWVDIDEKSRSVSLTDEGIDLAESRLREAGLLSEGHLYDVENVTLVHHLNQALRAHKLYTREKDYILRNGQVVIVDEFTGRMAPGRRFSGGLHQALEAKEGVETQPENHTLASVTYQNYFRLFEKLGGMTGTAKTEAEEFGEIYGLDVVDVPTNVTVARVDDDDLVYLNQEQKLKAITDQVADCVKRGQPALVGTVSIEKSEKLSEVLKQKKIPHQVLNARHHESEAKIIANAGVPGAITIATNMAGRGTDIQLGGNLEMRIEEEAHELEGEARDQKVAQIRADVESKREEAVKAGGLFVIGSERHESRRIDNQLRGRSGRQGDPGRSLFYLALDDDLMRIFASDRVDKMLQTLGVEDNEAITHPWVNKAIERAQSKVEARNYEIRKSLLKFDNVLNEQRKVIFGQRRWLMSEESVSETVDEMRAGSIDSLSDRFTPEGVYPDQWDLDAYTKEAEELFVMSLPVAKWYRESPMTREAITDRVTSLVETQTAKRRAELGKELSQRTEKTILLRLLDELWREHIVRLEHLRQVIGFRGFAQRDPLSEYKSEAFQLFDSLLGRLRDQVTRSLASVRRVETPKEGSPSAPEEPERRARSLSASPGGGGTKKISRNHPCPCGSGKKYKHCHGRVVS